MLLGKEKEHYSLSKQIPGHLKGKSELFWAKNCGCSVFISWKHFFTWLALTKSRKERLCSVFAKTKLKSITASLPPPAVWLSAHRDVAHCLMCRLRYCLYVKTMPLRPDQLESSHKKHLQWQHWHRCGQVRQTQMTEVNRRRFYSHSDLLLFLSFILRIWNAIAGQW